jgi:hypothetical protein
LVPGEREEGRKEGLREEIKEGQEKGIDLGEVIGRIRLCQKVLKQPEMPKEDLKKRSLEELARLVEQLEAQAFPPGT